MEEYTNIVALNTNQLVDIINGQIVPLIQAANQAEYQADAPYFWAGFGIGFAAAVSGVLWNQFHRGVRSGGVDV